MKPDDTMGRQLHSRLTEGESLTQEESEMLEAWYFLKDATEASVILRERNSRIDQLNRDISNTLQRIQETANSIQVLSVENDAIRTEIAERSRHLNPKAHSA
jgi:DNA phosphorothioation-dependent restriction protein DptG